MDIDELFKKLESRNIGGAIMLRDCERIFEDIKYEYALMNRIELITFYKLEVSEANKFIDDMLSANKETK